jgi:tetratricopeptide (TPR) repeat protein
MSTPSPVLPAEEILERVRRLYDAGLSLQAWQLAQLLGSWRHWPDTSARVLAGRLASQLCADRLGDALLVRAWRADRNAPEAVLYGAMALSSIRGSLAALDLLNASGILDADTAQRWDATAYAARLYATFRDFETADRLIARAFDASGTAWIWAQQAAIHEMADRYPEALEASRRALQIDPRSRSAIYYTAHLLSLSERDAEAIALLRNALATLEAPRVAAHLSGLEFETGQFHAALATLDRYEALTPIKDKSIVSWLADRRCDIHSRLGDRPRALEEAKRSSSGFYKQVALRLEQAAPEARQVMLPVGFVRQHHMTCAPATLSALSRYWSRPADHLEMAESICYDGTPHHSQRRWAAGNGWHVREFTVSWQSARALLDAGIPFTLTTVYPGGSHLQAAIGYDEARGTLVIRDPTERVHTEFTEGPFFESYRSSGPRGMALVPAAERARLDALDLPETALHELAHDVQDALVAHDRERAAVKCAEITALAPGHRLDIGMRRSLASYDGNLPANLRTTEELLVAYPDDVNLRLSKASLLRRLAPHQDHLDYIRAQCSGPAAHAMLRLRLAQTLLEDARYRAEAIRILRRLVRGWCKPETLSSLGDAHWRAGEYPRAVELYRFASTLSEADEDHAQAYFRAARMVRGAETALAYLRQRIRRLGPLSAAPAMTLFECLEELDRATEAMTVLDEALAVHPEDGTLLLFAARNAVEIKRADEFLARARGRSRELDWLKVAARIHRQRGELTEALQRWEQVAAAEPLDLGAQRAIASLKHELGGRATTVEYLRAASERFPHHQDLCELFVDWLDEAPLPQQEAALQRLLDLNPTNAWAQRQLALVLARQRRFEEAHARANIARELAPNTVSWHSAIGNIYFLEGHREAAREQFRHALRLSVDSEFALNRLLEACANIEERRAELTFVLEEMKRQVVYGDSLLIYQRQARDTVEPETLAAFLDEARGVRPDLWQAWVACLRQHIELQQYDRARAVCDEALARFPLLPRLHVESAEIARVTGDRAAERAALTEALRLSPGWGLVARKLADAFEAEGNFVASRQTLESALRHSPADAMLRGYLGYSLWQLGERDNAITQFEQSAALDPEYDWAWRMFKERAAQEGRPNAAIELARRLAAQRPGELRTWIAVARVADAPEEKLAALDRAIALSPLALDANERKLDLLIELKRYDEALALVDATAWGEQAPIVLRAKACRILAARGDTPAAIARMDKVLAAEPNHHPGWELLADWHSAREDWPAYLTAAREMLRLEPNDSRSIGYFAHALSKAEPQTDIRPYLRRAQHLKPDYTYAGNKLFDLELEAGEFDAAESALRTLSAHIDTGYTRWRGILLATKRGDRQAALDLFRKMWFMLEDDVDPFKDSLQVLIDAGWRQDAERVIEELMFAADVNPHIGTLWVERRASVRYTLRRFHGFERVLATGAAGQYAAQALLRHHKVKKNVRALRRLLRRYREEFTRNDETYGLVGFALVGNNLVRDAAAWFVDWRAHSGLEPWMLLNLAGALRDLGRDAEAAEAGQRALTRTRDHTFNEHNIWLAVDAGFAGDRANAERLLANVDEKEISDYRRFLFRIAQALAAISGEPVPLSAVAYARAVDRLRGLFRLVPTFLKEPALHRYLGRALWRIIRARGGNTLAALGLWFYFVLVVLWLSPPAASAP